MHPVQSLHTALIGCGHIGAFHARNLRDAARSNDVPMRYVATCDLQLDRARRFADLGGCSTATAEAAELLQRPDVDAVYICTETAEHVALVEAAAAAGKHVFCEKPLACSLADAERMLAAVTRAGVTHQVGLVLRYSPVMRVIEDLMQQPDLGPLLTAYLRDDQFFPVGGHYGSSWRADVSRAGGGTLLEHSIHDVDLFLRLFGPVARVRCHTRETRGYPGIEDVALATFEHVGGHQTQLASVWHGVDGRPSTRRLEVFFEGGWIATDHDYFGSITWQGRSGPAVTLSAQQVQARYCELEGLDADAVDERWLAGLEDRRFLTAAAAGLAAAPDFATAVAAHRVVDACYRSAKSDTAVALAP